MKVWIEVLQLASRLNLKYLRRFIFLQFLPHFCFPLGRPWGNHAKCCMDGKRIRCLQMPRSIYASAFNSSPVIRTASAKNRHFTYRSPHFCSPGDAPAIITQYVAWMERQFNACQTHRSKYLSIFNSFRVIRCLSQCVSPKIAIFTTFLFPLGMPLGQSR